MREAMNNETIKATLGLDTTPYKAALTDADRRAQSWAGRFKASMKGMMEPFKMLKGAGLLAIGTAVADFINDIRDAKKEARELDAAISKALRPTGGQGTSITELQSQLQEVNALIDKLSGPTSKSIGGHVADALIAGWDLAKQAAQKVGDELSGGEGKPFKDTAGENAQAAADALIKKRDELNAQVAEKQKDQNTILELQLDGQEHLVEAEKLKLEYAEKIQAAYAAQNPELAKQLKHQLELKEKLAQQTREKEKQKALDADEAERAQQRVSKLEAAEKKKAEAFDKRIDDKLKTADERRDEKRAESRRGRAERSAKAADESAASTRRKNGRQLNRNLAEDERETKDASRQKTDQAILDQAKWTKEFLDLCKRRLGKNL